MKSFPIIIDLDAALPVYAQIETQMRHLLAGGYWRAGDQVPSVREMAVRLKINPLTVQKVYRNLKKDKLLVSRPGAGVYAAEGVARASRRMKMAREAIDEAIAAARSLGLEREAIEELVERALNRRRPKTAVKK